MAYDEGLADRVRELLAERDGISEKKMFGGLSFLLDGNMCCGVARDDLVVRLSPEEAERALAELHARPMDFTGRPLKGFVYVSPQGVADETSLLDWIDRAVRFAGSLPPK